MNDRSREILRRVEQNDATLKKLRIGYRGFLSSRVSDYSILCASIGKNTHLTTLIVHTNSYGLDSIHFPKEFAECLKRNSSIHELEIYCNSMYIVDEVVIGGILDAYQENNGHLTQLTFRNAHLQNGEHRLIANTLRRCTNLKQIGLPHCDISNKKLLPIIEAVRQNNSLEELNLLSNEIGNAGCDAIATLLGDPNCNLHTLNLEYNDAIAYEGATAIANGLARNSTLRELNLGNNSSHGHNHIDPSVRDVFSRVLCDTSSINSIYFSNHTLEELELSPQPLGTRLAALLKLNKGRNKSHVAIRKILTCHPNINMEAFFRWGKEDERDLTALPYVLAWFERAGEVVYWGKSYNINRRKLNTIFQFARAMPLLFVPAAHIKEGNNKRKRDDMQRILQTRKLHERGRERGDIHGF